MSITVLSGLQQGFGENQRTGKVVTWRNIAVRGSVEGNADSVCVIDPGLILIMLIYDKQFNGATPTAADILQYGVGPTVPPAANYNPSSCFLNMKNAERFVVLRRYMKTLAVWEKDGGQQGYAGSPSVDTIDWNLDVELQTMYNGTGAGVANMTSGAIILCATADVAPNGSPTTNNRDWKFVWHARLRYVDG